MSLARALWWLAAAAVTLPFLDVAWRTLPSRRNRFVEHATRARLILGAAELALAVLYLAAARGRVRLAAGPDPRPALLLALLGAPLALAGGLLAAWAKVTLGRLFSATFGVKEGHRLITSGPYAVVRHPIYAGLVAFLAGSALVWNDAALLGVAAAAALLFAAHVRVEEAMFIRHFGEAYRQYQRRTPALLPLVGRRRSGAP
ncbi:MAG TPA: isoprenylcysteine carboxylmethyltransferase family protein [Gemmatimonadaceae bacterium]|nr:isoprenylcysteine carboxylmethyltransferase family protein [Gemmatimonadaceae bacterium]